MNNYYYYPSCKFKAQFKQEGDNISEYLASKGVKTLGCCRLFNSELKENDIGICICTSCDLILKEVTNVNIISIYKYLLDDELAIDDDNDYILLECYKANDEFKTSVIDFLNQKEISFEISKIKNYCGEFFFNHMSKANLNIAPKIFNELEKRVSLLSEDEVDDYFNDNFKIYKDKKLLVYCNSCYKALKERNYDVTHLGELIYKGIKDGTS